MASSKSRRRRRKRRRPQDAPAPAAPRPAPPPQRRTQRSSARGREAEGPPPAPWGSFPLVELAVLAGIVMLLLGLLVLEGEQSKTLIGAGLLLASLGGLELALREHLAGYRSHTLVLSAACAVLVLAVLFFLGPEGLPPVARVAIGLAAGGAAALLLTRLFQSRSGGYAFRVSRPRR